MSWCHRARRGRRRPRGCTRSASVPRAMPGCNASPPRPSRRDRSGRRCTRCRCIATAPRIGGAGRRAAGRRGAEHSVLRRAHRCGASARHRDPPAVTGPVRHPHGRASAVRRAACASSSTHTMSMRISPCLGSRVSPTTTTSAGSSARAFGAIHRFWLPWSDVYVGHPGIRQSARTHLLFPVMWRAQRDRFTRFVKRERYDLVHLNSLVLHPMLSRRAAVHVSRARDPRRSARSRAWRMRRTRAARCSSTRPPASRSSRACRRATSCSTIQST